jgi:hypothetical protein
MNKEVLIAFCISRGGEAADLATFEAGIGCPRANVVSNILREPDLYDQFTPLLRRLESYAIDAESFVNLCSISCIVQGGTSDCAAVFDGKYTLQLISSTLL